MRKPLAALLLVVLPLAGLAAGAVLAVELDGGAEAGTAFVDGQSLPPNIADIGDGRSLVIHPAKSPHAQLTPDQQAL